MKLEELREDLESLAVGSATDMAHEIAVALRSAAANPAIARLSGDQVLVLFADMLEKQITEKSLRGTRT